MNPKLVATMAGVTLQVFFIWAVVTEADAAAQGTMRTPNTNENPPLRVIRIGTFRSAIDYAPFYLSKYDDCPASLMRAQQSKLEYKVFSSVSSMNDAVNSGRLDIILEADTPAIMQRAAGTDIRMITPLAALTQQLLVPNSSPVRGLPDLVGKRIGVLFGSGYHFAVVSGMANLHLSPEMYSTIDVAPTAGGRLLAAGSIDAWAIWPPILQQEQANGDVRAIAGSAFTLNVYAFGAGPFMDSHPRFTAGFLHCMHQALQHIHADPSAAIRVTAAETGLSPNVVRAAWPTMAFGFYVDRQTVDTLNGQATFLFDHGYTPKRVQFDKASFYDLGQGVPPSDSHAGQ